jgi:hypothetical protein
MEGISEELENVGVFFMGGTPSVLSHFFSLFMGPELISRTARRPSLPNLPPSRSRRFNQLSGREKDVFDGRHLILLRQY